MSFLIAIIGNGNVIELPTKNMNITDISQRLSKLASKFDDSQ